MQTLSLGAGLVRAISRCCRIAARGDAWSRSQMYMYMWGSPGSENDHGQMEREHHRARVYPA